ncbi:hypothetical protein MtrunA17_Chr5g0447161 [Medicago truncatula]|uniref:Uncharacterized protein n=1 Tax=Medicago truncatula TaxID=3880 RepID=A0A396HXK6_MEDTR|nr:hypothetical protein MtrunA17_Chr5g0447161 [Medicago truncatula]
MGPIPSKWRGNGICQFDTFIGSRKTHCNRYIRVAFRVGMGKSFPPYKNSFRSLDLRSYHGLSILYFFPIIFTLSTCKQPKKEKKLSILCNTYNNFTKIIHNFSNSKLC